MNRGKERRRVFEFLRFHLLRFLHFVMAAYIKRPFEALMFKGLSCQSRLNSLKTTIEPYSVANVTLRISY